MFKFITHRPEDHVQWHGDVKVKGIIIGHTGDEEHENQKEIVLESDVPLSSPKLLGHHESLQGHESELAEGD